MNELGAASQRRSAARRRCLFTAATAAASLIAGCSEHVCRLVACLNGLTIQLDGEPPVGRSKQVVISVNTGTESVPIANCEWGAAGSSVLRCASSGSHSEIGSSILLADETFTSVRVTISDGMATIADQTFMPEYTSREINGPGCGVCTSATVVVNAR